ncbi:hypothetical protein HK101_005799, partial [Irineochytrium annulatum]
ISDSPPMVAARRSSIVPDDDSPAAGARGSGVDGADPVRILSKKQERSGRFLYELLWSNDVKTWVSFTLFLLSVKSGYREFGKGQLLSKDFDSARGHAEARRCDDEDKEPLDSVCSDSWNDILTDFEHADDQERVLDEDQDGNDLRILADDDDDEHAEEQHKDEEDGDSAELGKRKRVERRSSGKIVWELKEDEDDDKEEEEDDVKMERKGRRKRMRTVVNDDEEEE